MIDALSSKIARTIKRNVDGITDEKEEIIGYGINLILHDLIVISVVFLLSIVFSLFKYILISFLVYSSIRVSAGGAHSGTRTKCTIETVLTLFVIVIISKYIWAANYYPSLIIFIINLFIIYAYAPGDTVQKPILSSKMKRRLRILSLLAMTAIFILSIIIWHFDKVIYNIMVLTTIPVVFLLTPIGYKLSKCSRSCEKA